MSVLKKFHAAKRVVRWDRERVITVALTIVGLTLEVASYSVLTPFYPNVAKKKGNDATQIGIVLSVSPFVGFVSSPFIGKMFTSGITPKRGITLGLVIDGTFLILMAFLLTIESSLGFFVVSVFLRLVEAIGFSMCLTGYYTLTSTQFPRTLQIVAPFLETFFGLGAMIGPSAGDLLYNIGGYHLPFFVFGSCSLTVALLTHVLLSDDRDSRIDALPENETPKLAFVRLLKDHRVIFDLVAVAVGYHGIGFNVSTLALWIEQFKLSISMSSLIFLTYGIVYSASGIFNGFLSNRFEDCRVLVLIEGVLFCIGISLLGPLPFIHMEPSPWLTLAGQLLMGVGNGALYSLSYLHSMKYVIARLNHPAESATYAVVTCLVSTSFFFGMFMGSVLGGFLLDTVGYRWASLIVLLNVVIPMLPMYPLVIRDHSRKILQSTEDPAI